MAAQDRLEQSIKRAGLLVAAGLAVEAATAAFVHPFAFIAFLLVACPLVAAGVFLFLWALVTLS